MHFHRKIGGIHWFAFGPWRVSVCKRSATPKVRLPAAMPLEAILASVDFEIQAETQRQFSTYTDTEHNHFIF